MKPTLAVLLGLGACGCGDELRLAQSIQENRLLASRVEVAGAPAEAWPAPGQDALVRHLVVDPGERAPLSWVLAACPRDASSSSVARCAGDVFASSVQTTPVLAEPNVPLAVPPESELAGAGQLLVFGIVCPSSDVGRPTSLAAAWPDGFRCASTTGTRVETSVPLRLGSEGNRNPSLADDELELGNQPWPDPGDPWSLPVDCAGSGLPEVRAGSAEVPVRVVFWGDDREETSAGREALSVATFSTAGELSRAYSFVESDDSSSPPSVRVEWKVPSSAPAAGRLVRFHVVVRDGRGGTDWTTRALCVVP